MSRNRQTARSKTSRARLQLLPFPRSVELKGGWFALPRRASVALPAGEIGDANLQSIVAWLREGAEGVGVELVVAEESAKVQAPGSKLQANAEGVENSNEGYELEIRRSGISISYHEEGGLRAAAATLRQLFRQFGRKLPCLSIRDYPDFPKRGVMLDISRGRVPRLDTLLELVDHLADFKINEFQLYVEHTFAYRKDRVVWQDWGAITAPEIRKLDRHCRRLGIELVPNQNSFGHLRYWLEHEPYRQMAEVHKPYDDGNGTFLRFPSTLAPNHRNTLPFLRRLYDELLPNFSSRRFNVGCDETWDLGRGKSKVLCERRGKGRVYVDFLKRVHREVKSRGRQMMFWGDITLHYPELIRELPKDAVALNWGYEADHPFSREAATFAQAGLQFYVCPGTSTWMSLIGRHDNALANLRAAALAGKKYGARGFLNTDFGDGGHPQPLAVSYLPFVAGAALSWCAESFDEALLAPVLSRDVFHDATGRMAQAAYALGVAHRKFKFRVPNLTPFGAVIAAPQDGSRELFCRDGLKYYRQIRPANLQAALAEVEKQRLRFKTARPFSRAGKIMQLELDLAARMAAMSCKYMLWQQAHARSPGRAGVRTLAKHLIRELSQIERELKRYWLSRNKGTIENCAPFLRWRRDELRRA